MALEMLKRSVEFKTAAGEGEMPAYAEPCRRAKSVQKLDKCEEVPDAFIGMTLKTSKFLIYELQKCVAVHQLCTG